MLLMLVRDLLIVVVWLLTVSSCSRLTPMSICCRSVRQTCARLSGREKEKSVTASGTSVMGVSVNRLCRPITICGYAPNARRHLLVCVSWFAVAGGSWWWESRGQQPNETLTMNITQRQQQTDNCLGNKQTNKRGFSAASGASVFLVCVFCLLYACHSWWRLDRTVITAKYTLPPESITLQRKPNSLLRSIPLVLLLVVVAVVKWRTDSACSTCELQ